MFCIVVYDIDMSNGQKRLTKVSKICEQYGIRVQNSVFEMDIDLKDLTILKTKLTNVINASQDSIRIYYLGSKANTKVELLGKQEQVELLTQTTIML